MVGLILVFSTNKYKSRAPIDCVQYYTGRQGTIESYGWAGSQLIEGMDYQMCVR